MNFFIVEQINGEGNSTGLTKMIKGALEASKFIMREESDDNRKQKIADSIRKMQPGDFDAINSGKYIYEVDCMSEKDVEDVEVDPNDLICPEDTAVFEIFKEEKDIDYAFGIDDLRKKLVKIGVEPEMVSKLNLDSKEEFSFEITDPDHINISVKLLSDRDVEKLKSTNSAFALDLEISMKSKIFESEENKPAKTFDSGDYRIEIYPISNSKFYYEISRISDGRFLTHGSFFNSIENAEECAKQELESDEFKKDIILKDSKKYNYFHHNVEVIKESNGKFCSTISIAGNQLKKKSGFRTIDEAIKFSNFAIDSGINENSDDMVEIEFSIRVAQKAQEAIDDNRYISGNVEWTSSNTIAFKYDKDNENDSMLDDIKEQLESFGISEDEYEIIF